MTSLAILFDLDDTLLSTRMDRFLPGYFQALGEALSHLGSPEKIIQQVHHAVQKMAANQDPGKTLKAVFAEHFYEPLGTTQEACDAIIRTFYQEQYPHLRPITQTMTTAPELVDWCRSQGITMAIATNPLFPYTATCQRVQWAGLDPRDFTFITSYNDFHFTKPNLTYYAEVLGRLGWPDGRIVMIGDDLTLDLLPMESMGYETFWVHQDGQEANRASGSLSEVIPWLQQVIQNNELTLSNQPEVNIAILRSTLAVLDTWLQQILTDLLNMKTSKNVGQFVGILQHLTDCEYEVFQPAWDQIQSDPRMTLPVINHAQDHHYTIDLQQSPNETFTRLLNARQTSLSSLESIFPELTSGKLHCPEISNKANISNFLGLAAQHDRFHLNQCANLLDICKIN